MEESPQPPSTAPTDLLPNSLVLRSFLLLWCIGILIEFVRLRVFGAQFVQRLLSLEN